MKIRLARCWRVGRRVVCGSDDALPTVSAAISLRGCGSGTRQVRCLGNWRRLGGLFRLRSVHVPVTETGSGAAPLCHPAGTGRVPPRGAGLCVAVPVIPEVREAGREPTGVGRGRLRRRPSARSGSRVNPVQRGGTLEPAARTPQSGRRVPCRSGRFCLPLTFREVRTAAAVACGASAVRWVRLSREKARTIRSCRDGDTCAPATCAHFAVNQSQQEIGFMTW